MNGLLGNDFLDRDVQAKRIAEQRKRALMEGMLQASKLSGRPPRDLSEQEMQVLLNPPLLPSLQESIESASEDPYTSHIPSQQDMWREQAKIKDFYSQAPPEGVGGGYKSTLSDLQGYSILPPPQYAGSPGSPHSIDLETVSGESIPGPEVTPLQQRRMNAQMVPGFYEAFGGGHPDEISPTEAEQLYGYGQFSSRTRDPVSGGLLAEVPDNEETGWYRDDRLNPDKRRKLNPEWMRLINQGMNIYGG